MVGCATHRDWLKRFCIFGDRICSFREQHPCSQQWGQKILHCHIADGLDKQHPNYCQSECDEIRGTFEEIFSRYSDLEFSYLDERSLVDGYQLLLCSHCQIVRSTPFAIYRISPTTSVETFVAIGISIALEKLFSYKIPKMLLVRQKQDLPSLLEGYEVVEAVCMKEVKQKLKTFLPKVIQVSREESWRPRSLPFLKNIHTDDSQNSDSDNVPHSMTIDKFWSLIESSKKQSKNDDLQVERLEQYLSELPIYEIFDFQRIFISIYHYSYRSYLRDAASIIMSYCSDDGFDYFRAWLIAQGKDIFHDALKDQNTLVEIVRNTSKRNFQLEAIMYAAPNVYEAKNNELIPDTVYDYLKESPELVPSCEIVPPYQFPKLMELCQNKDSRNSFRIATVRISELSKELNLASQDVVARCNKLNIPVKSHSSRITEYEAARIRADAGKYV